MISFGDTKVICSATLSDRVPPFLRSSGTGWVTAEYAMLPGSASGGRISRDATRKGRAMEISRLIGRSLRSVTDMRVLGERQIVIDCDVIQADGGTRTAAITGAYVALHDAFSNLIERGELERSPLTAQCGAVSVGIVNGRPLLDLDYQEDFAAAVDMNVVMTGEGQFVELQGTGEEATFSDRELASLIKLAKSGIGQLRGIQKKSLGAQWPFGKRSG